MKNRIIIFLLYIFFFVPSLAENLNIQSSSITVDKKTKITIFKNQVSVKDKKNNQLLTEFAEYDKDLQLLKTVGKTTVLTSGGFVIEGEDILFDNNKNYIKSDNPATILDLEKNEIYLDSFEYSTSDGFFKSAGKIEIIDSKNNRYNFSQIYIDEKKKEIVGTDSKAFLNQEDFKINKDNKPRVFSNTVNIYEQKTKFTKSIFTLCDYRKNDKCPPWSLQAKEMLHDKKKKTIYYNNAVIKVYDFPILFLPKLSHPDPTVDRRSGFLIPSFSDSKNLGAGFDIPYFWALDKDKDFTLRNKLFASENPLFLGEYRQAFKKSNLILDFGYTEGYKKTTTTKKSGDKSHFFSKFIKNFKGKNNSDNNIELTVQNVSNDKYLKLYKIKSNLIEYEKDILENSFTFNRENENSFLGFKASAYETLKDGYNDKYEYILPDVIFDRNLFASNKYGNLDLTSNLNIHNYDTNKFTKFLVNDLDWKFKTNNFASGLKGNWIGKLKNVNYETKNTSEYKDDPETEFFGALGYLSKIDLFKNNNNNNYLLTPKMLLRYAPGNMRKDNTKFKLNNKNIFSLDRLNSYNNFENGLSATLGFDYEVKNNEKELNFSIGQIINKKENQDMPSSSSLDEKLSDLVGNANIKINNSLDFDYNFALDQNYKDLNYNEIGFNFDLNPIKFDIDYLQEKKHIGNQEYFKTNLEYSKGNNGLFAFEMKRNIITNSSEYYNLSYEYLNDCLRAGLVYRREFYNDSELESENSLMFKITLTPFGDIRSPAFNQ
jgi:LPS-assembly protein